LMIRHFHVQHFQSTRKKRLKLGFCIIKKLARSWALPFFKIFKGLLFGWTL